MEDPEREAGFIIVRQISGILSCAVIVSERFIILVVRQQDTAK